MSSVEDVALEAGSEVVLGDQRIEELLEQISIAAQEANGARNG